MQRCRIARLHTAAALTRSNMPMGAGNTLTEAEALDIAAYFTRQPRPDFPPKKYDWPKGERPSDVPY